jgi:hypothetical protein
MLEDAIAAIVGFLLMAAFAVGLAFTIGALPLIIVTVIVVAMAAVELWQSALRGNRG